MNRYKIRPGAHTVRITKQDVERDCHILRSELGDLIVGASLARAAGDEERRSHYIDAAQRLFLELQALAARRVEP